MARNLVMCLDGTAGQAKGASDSNCVRAYELLDLTEESAQIAYYDPGVGTFASSGAWTPFARWLSKMGGLIYGAGLRQNLGEAYSWLMREWHPGDRVYVFGFSRGAYTARALTGMLRVIGLMRPGSDNQIQYAVSRYARRGGEDAIPWDEVHRFAELFAQTVDGKTTVPIEYLGLWDSVKALGIARFAPNWPYVRSLPNARRIRHAISIDERRRPFAEYRVNIGKDGYPSRLEEAWFAGIHSDVGGTFVPDSRLSSIAFRWVMEGAIDAGLLVKTRKAQKLFASIDADYAAGALHRNFAGWNLLIPRTRPIPSGALVHASVRERRRLIPGYLKVLPAGTSWAEENWPLATTAPVSQSAIGPDGALKDHDTPPHPDDPELNRVDQRGGH